MNTISLGYKKVLLAVVAATLLLTAVSAQAADTGFQNPTANAADTGGDGNGFELGPTNAYADGGANATNNNGPADRHRYWGYDFSSIPATAAIDGIEVRLDWWLSSASDNNSMSVELSWNGGTTWTSAQTTTPEPTSQATTILGGATDTWGHAWTVSELSNANFRVRITSNCSGAIFNTCGSRDFFLDWAPVRIYYSTATTTTVVSDIFPSVSGQTVTFTANVSSASGTPTGTVNFLDDATVIGTGALAGGVATFSTNALTVGSHNITAVYAGDGTFGASTSPIFVQNVNQAPTITNSTLAFTFSVGTAGNFAVTTTGFPTPTFILSGDPLPSGVTFDTNTGIFGGTPAPGTIGAYNFTVTATNGISPDDAENFTLNVVQGNQTINFPPPASPQPYGATFNINPTASSGLPITVAASGVCAIVPDASPPGYDVTINSGTGTCTLTASQAGDVNFSAAPDVVHTVAAQRATPTIAVQPSPHSFGDPSQSFYSHPMTFTVTVTAPAGSSGNPPSGTVTLTGGNPPQNITVTLSGGVALFTTSNLNSQLLPHLLTFTYNGDSNYNPVNSGGIFSPNPVYHQVLPAPTQVTVTSDINPSAVGQTVTFTITISTIAPGTGIPPGTVTLFDGATAISGALTLNGSGVATFNTSTLTFGSHNISAQYTSSSNNYANSNNTADPYVQVVNHVTTTTLTSDNNPSVYGENVTFTANVSSATPGTITGSITFMDGATVIGTDTTIVGGEATFTINSLVVGAHSITAVYSGDSIYAASASPVVDQAVDKATLNVTANNQTIIYGDADPLFSFQYSGFVLSETAAVIDTPPTCTVLIPHVNVGTYPIVCSGGLDNNYDFNYIDGTLTVAQKTLTITADNQGKIYGDIFTFTGTEFTTTGLIFSDTVTSVTLTSAGAPAAAPAGAYPIVPSNAVGVGLANYAISYVNGTMTVATNVLTISANNQSKTYGNVFTFTGTEFTVVGLQPGDSVTSVTLTSAGAPSPANVGTYPIIASNAAGIGLSSYTIVYNAGQMNVNPRNLTFTPDNKTKVYGSVFTAHTGTFTGLRTGDTITPIYDSVGAVATATVGTYPITVTLDDGPEDELNNYIVTIDAATLTVTPRALTVTPDDQTKIYGDVFTAFSGSITGIQNGDNITANYDSIGSPATADVGTYPITATLNDPDGRLGNYAVTLNTGTLTVTERDLIVTSDSQTKIYSDVFTAFTGSITGIQNGDNITATYNSLGAPAAAPFGTYPINITLADPDNKLGNYNVILNIGTLTVTRRDLTFTPDDKTKIYGDTFTAFTGTITGLQNGDAIAPIYSSPGSIATAPVGDYPITITLNDPDNKLGNYNFTIDTATLTVTARDLIVTPDDQTKQYGTWFIAFTGTITGIQNGDNITANYASAGSPPSAAVGDYPITATLNDPTGKLGNYNVTLNTSTLTVTSSSLTVTADNKTIVYGNPDPTFTFTYTGFAGGDTPAVINTPPTCTVAGPHTDVGTYPIVCSGGVDDAYTFTYVAGTLTVTPRALVVIPGDKTKVYGDVFTAFTGTITGLQFTDVITATYASPGAPATAPIGDYPITATLVDPGNRLGNYTVTLNTGTLTVTLRALTVTPADKTKVYGDVFTAFTGTITGIQNGEAITATYTSPGAAATATVAGSPYPITATLNAPAGVLANYSIVLNTGDLTVTPRALVVTPDNHSKLFGTVFTAFTGTITGIQNGDAITATYASAGAPAAAPAGTYPITATVNAPAGVLANYTVTLNQGTLTVGSSVLTVTANNQTMVYGDPDPAFTFTYSGFAPGDTPAVLTSQPTCQVAVPHNNVGAFPITCSGGVDDNYLFSYVSATLTVTPRALTVTPNNASKPYGDTFTTFTGVITGIQGGDNITATYASTGAPSTAAVGAYPITATLNDPGGRLVNYTVTLNTGTLTVTPRALLVTPTDASKIYGNVFTVFTGTIVGIQNGDPITATYASPGAAAAATVGIYPITATLNAPAGILANYTVTSNTGTLTVTQRDLIVTPADKTKVYGTLFTAFTGTITGIQNGDPITATYASPGAPVAAAVGDYPINATLNDPNGRLPNYNVTLNTGTLTVNQATTTTAVTSDNNPAGVAEIINFTATVTSSSGTPTGAVTFFDGGNSLGTVPLTSGAATLSTSVLTVGTHTITVTYNGDANFAGSTSAPYIQGVGQSVTTTVLTSNNNPSAFGQSVTFTAIVSSATGIPTGTVSFNEGVSTLGTGALNAGMATFSTSALTSGLHNIVASYSGDPDFFGSVSSVLVQTVGPDTIIDSNPPNPDNDLTPIFTFSSTSTTATFACRLDGGAFSPCNSGDAFGPLTAGNHTFEVRATDSLGNVDPTPAFYSWVIDTSTPDTVINTNPPAVTNSTDATFTFSSPAIDLAGFECQLDGGGFTACATPHNIAGISAGSHEFEVRAYDTAGNRDLSPASYTWTVDLSYPTVLFNANTVPADGAVLGAGPTKIKVAFSKDVKNDGSADAVNNPANFLLVEDGVNNTFDTVSCLAGLAADDTSIPIATPIYKNGNGSGPFVATFTINGGTRLPDGTYRLLVCGTTSIHDLADNELNNGVSDTAITFTVQRGAGGGGGGGGGGGNGTTSGNLLLPVTGFPQGEVTALDPQPAEKAYTATDVWMEIPRLNLKMSIVGVPQTKNGWDVSWLGNNAGWLNGSAFPGWNGNSIITGHVWNSNNKPGPFANLLNLQYGDKIKIHSYGQVYTFEITSSSLILPTNVNTAFKHEETPWLTLITCENYVEKTETYTHRRMLRAVLVSVEKEK